MYNSKNLCLILYKLRILDVVNATYSNGSHSTLEFSIFCRYSEIMTSRYLQYHWSKNYIHSLCCFYGQRLYFPDFLRLCSKRSFVSLYKDCWIDNDSAECRTNKYKNQCTSRWNYQRYKEKCYKFISSITWAQEYKMIRDYINEL